MPLTMLAAAAIDVTPARRAEAVAELLRYLGTDLVCFPLSEDEAATEEDRKLVARQASLWRLPSAHFLKTYGAVAVASAREMVAPKHPDATTRRARERLEGMSDWELTAALSLAQGCKSLVIPLAILDREVPVEQAITAARVEEEHQIEHWGLVEGGHDVDHANQRVQILAAALLKELSSAEPA